MTRTMSLTIPSLIPKSQARARSLLPGRTRSEPDDDEFPAENVIDPDEELWARLHILGAGQEPAPMDIPAWGTEQTTIRECQRLMAGHVATYPPRQLTLFGSAGGALQRAGHARQPRTAFAGEARTLSGPCKLFAVAHQSKQPMLLVSTCSTTLAGPDQVKTWPVSTNAQGVQEEHRKVTTQPEVTAIYRKDSGVINCHNHKRQGAMQGGPERCVGHQGRRGAGEQ
eukprot:jgi/Mesvir1/29109/Mv18415-RA.1